MLLVLATESLYVAKAEVVTGEVPSVIDVEVRGYSLAPYERRQEIVIHLRLYSLLLAKTQAQGLDASTAYLDSCLPFRS